MSPFGSGGKGKDRDSFDEEYRQRRYGNCIKRKLELLTPVALVPPLPWKLILSAPVPCETGQTGLVS